MVSNYFCTCTILPLALIRSSLPLQPAVPVEPGHHLRPALRLPAEAGGPPPQLEVARRAGRRLRQVHRLTRGENIHDTCSPLAAMLPGSYHCIFASVLES